MRETTLLKIALVSGLAGLILLFGVLETTPPREVTISSIRTEDIRGEVLIRGTVTRIAHGNATQWLEIVDAEPFGVVVFREEAIPLKPGDRVEVRGKMTEYNGKKQFDGEEVRVV